MRSFAALCATLCGIASALAQPERFVFEHPSPDGSETRTFRAQIDRPEGNANGFAVMLIGGGSVTDEDWTVMGSYELDGEITRVTIDNAPTRDAKTIGDALVDAGFTVMRWSSIHEDDELAKETPGMAMGVPFTYSVGLARAARDAFRERAPDAESKLILVGHSLGAPRATACADDGVAGLVFLAGAYTSRTTQRPSEMAKRAMGVISAHDQDGDGRLDPGETPEPYADRFGAIDADGDGALRDWEIAAAMRGGDNDADAPELRPGVPWPSDVIRDRRLPTLAIYGGLDRMSVHGPWLQKFADKNELNDVLVEFRAALGHQLSPEQDGLIGPIDERVVARIVEWCLEQTP